MLKDHSSAPSSPTSSPSTAPSSPSTASPSVLPNPFPKYPFSLARSKYAAITPDSGATSSSHPLSDVQVHTRPDASIYITGSVVDKLLTKLKISDKNNSLRIKRESQNNDHNYHDLAKVDQGIFQLVKEQYYASFILSPEFQKFYEIKMIIQKDYSSLTETEFDCMRVLGKGGFGRVFACRSAYTGKLFAMKVMNKKRIKMNKTNKMCLAERDILFLLPPTPFIISLKYSFTNQDNLYLVLDLMIGGDLSYHLNERNFTLEETKYYTVRIIMALITLHDLNYVYRDLKPENILLDADGQSKLSDLGLVDKIAPECKGLAMVCGTRGYWAPEILLADPKRSETYYSFDVDWFSLGCCIYEFLTGFSPFRNEKAINWKKLGGGGSNQACRTSSSSDYSKDGVGSVTSAKEKERHKDNAKQFFSAKESQDYSLDCALLEMEPDLSEIENLAARDLIAKLLIKNPKKRFGHNKNYQEIMSHEFFSDISWNSVHTMKPPFQPLLKSNAALSSEVGDFVDDKELKKVDWEKKDEDFLRAWNYISPDGLQEEFVEFLVNQEEQVKFILSI
jgi:beta-adrenergic-receptor kinase